jgi:D-alanyl-D-alanine carboxypeptidase
MMRPHVTTIRTILAAAMVLAVLGAPSGVNATSARRADRALERSLRRLVAMPGGPPGAIAIVQRGRRLRVHTAGVSDLATGEGITPSDHMRLASVSKAFNGAAALSLVAQGMLALGDTIAQRLPGLPRAWGAVTLAHLLRHTSGLPDYLSSPAAQEAIAGSLTSALPADQLLGLVADRGLEFEPGSRYRYSNSDNVAVALMIEAAARTSYERALQTEVFGPLRLRETSLPRGTLLPTPYVHGYDEAGTGTPDDLSEVLDPGWAWASGGMVATPRDLNRFIRGYVGGRLFRGPTRRAQLRFLNGARSDPAGPGHNAAGLAVYRYRTRCGTVFGHTGNFPGYTQFAAASGTGARSATVSVNLQLRPDLDRAVFAALRRAETRAVCAAMASAP